MTATVLLDDGREVEIPVEYLSAKLAPRIHHWNHQVNQK